MELKNKDVFFSRDPDALSRDIFYTFAGILITLAASFMVLREVSLIFIEAKF